MCAHPVGSAVSAPGMETEQSLQTAVLILILQQEVKRRLSQLRGGRVGAQSLAGS